MKQWQKTRLLCPPKVHVSLCVLHTPSLHRPCSSLMKAPPSPRFCQSFTQAVLTLPSHTSTPCLPRRKLRARWEVPGAAFLKQAYRSCVWGSPVNCQSSSYSESILLAVLWNDTFSRGDHTWSPSWSHMATKAVLRDALFTSMILSTFTDRKAGWRVLEGDRMFT